MAVPANPDFEEEEEEEEEEQGGPTHHPSAPSHEVGYLKLNNIINSLIIWFMQHI